MARTIRVGSRGSELALIQARATMTALEATTRAATKLVIIETTGDRVTDRPLNRVGGAGLFIKEIESALLEDRIDVAVHSMKDVPSVVPDHLSLAATLERIDPRDAWVANGGVAIESLPRGGRVATGSLRRRSQLLATRPDLHVEDLRGNVPTRLDKLDASDWHGIILAAAGLVRLGLEERITVSIPVEKMVPAVGQGALAIEIRTDDDEVRAAVAPLNHDESERAVACERAFLKRLEGGCQVPIGAHATANGSGVELVGFVGAVDGSRHLKRRTGGGDPETVGLALAEEMLALGAAEIIRDVAEVDD